MAPRKLKRPDGSSSKHVGGLHRGGKGGGSHGNGPKSIPGLPLWATIIIAVAAAVAALFIGGFIYHAIQERRRAKITGGSMRWKRVLWGAAKVAFFLWLVIGIFNLVKHRSWKGAKGSYKEIGEDQQRLNHGASGSTPAWDPNSQADTKYEPTGYNPAAYEPFSNMATSSQQSPRVLVTSSPQPPSRSRSPAGGLHRPPPDEDAAESDLASSRDQRISVPGFTHQASLYHGQQRPDASY